MKPLAMRPRAIAKTDAYAVSRRGRKQVKMKAPWCDRPGGNDWSQRDSCHVWRRYHDLVGRLEEAEADKQYEESRSLVACCD
jgi:hypothetical protein